MCQISEATGEPPGNLFATADDLAPAAHLAQAQGGLEFGGAVTVALVDKVETTGDDGKQLSEASLFGVVDIGVNAVAAMVIEALHEDGQFVVAGGRETANAGNQDVGGVGGKTTDFAK